MDRFDCLMIAGVLFVALGAAMIYTPLGFVVVGLGLMGASFLGARGYQPAKSDQQGAGKKG